MKTLSLFSHFCMCGWLQPREEKISQERASIFSMSFLMVFFYTLLLFCVLLGSSVEMLSRVAFKLIMRQLCCFCGDCLGGDLWRYFLSTRRPLLHKTEMHWTSSFFKKNK